MQHVLLVSSNSGYRALLEKAIDRESAANATAASAYVVNGLKADRVAPILAAAVTRYVPHHSNVAISQGSKIQVTATPMSVTINPSTTDHWQSV